MGGAILQNHEGNSIGRSPAPWRTVLCAFCANLIGVGLARFAYTPLVPAIVDAHWFDASTAAYLGAGNLAGYLAGAMLAHPLAARLSTIATLRAMMVLASVTFFACSYQLGFAWFFVGRAAAGLAGGALMVLAAPTALASIPASKRGLAGGAIFMGVGAGIAISGTLVPLLLQQGLQQTWLGLGGLALALTAAAWTGWPQGNDTPPAATGSRPFRGTATLKALYIEYALNAAGWVPHMIFLVDFVARGLGEGVAVGALYWIIFGIGATTGPLLAGHLADRIGFRAALRSVFLIEVIAVALPAGPLGQPGLLASSLVVGAFLTGTVPLVIGRIHELLPHHPAQHKRAWSLATIWFALFQAGAAYGLSFVFAQSGGNYHLLFLIGAAAIALAFALDVVVNRVEPSSRRGGAAGRAAPR